jgi:mono/diheme cytochrome c family protein
VVVPLPNNVYLADDPTARTVTLNRGVLTIMNAPALDPVIMVDGREPSLERQVLNAVLTHYEPRRQPSPREQRSLADLMRTTAFFSNPNLATFARGWPAPRLPEGVTPAQRRGRAFFRPDGACGVCHGGPMLNTPSGPAASRFASPNEISSTIQSTTLCLCGRVPTAPCPALIPGEPWLPAIQTTSSSSEFLSLWGVVRTAPYFHDNLAKSLKDVLAHYDVFFRRRGGRGLSARERADIVAFLQML